MEICSINDLKDKEVVSICDGSRLGYICDAELELCSGKLVAIIVPGCYHCFSLAKPQRIRICWDRIRRIGEDIILVDAAAPVCQQRHEGIEKGKKKRRRL